MSEYFVVKFLEIGEFRSEGLVGMNEVEYNEGGFGVEFNEWFFDIFWFDMIGIWCLLINKKDIIMLRLKYLGFGNIW